ncbi:TonB-dependent siderophore receptor [Sphingosinicella sp. CPCC 101087]|uniref:TonB-dependent receptor plug domain-containing protein n=1 Tax=Sphingosinicella sp. CPCC 101087 TaxID=2497754 RepID=UPI0013ED2E27|nr:TonB-dependent receptor [Sphingosinicella sp. CPCC 101087]
MMSTRYVFRHESRGSLRARWICGTALLALIGHGPALAQDEPATTESPALAPAQPDDVAQDQSPADIVITGSRIRGIAPVGSPLIDLGRDDIEASTAVTTDRMIRELPQVFDLGISENSRGQSGGNSNITYGNSVNLRGIGPFATLVLVDGHRVVGNSRSVDPSIIPTLGLQRVEVVADGASAIYGSDAVAGVVNLIPRRNLSGIEAIARYGVADDYDERLIGIAGGHTWSTGQVMVAFEHAYRSNLRGDDRAFFTNDQRPFGGRDYRITECDPGNIVVGGVSYAIPPGGVTPGTAGALQPGTQNLCDSHDGQDLFPETSYNSVVATFTQDITDWLTFFADGYFSKREFERNPAFAAAVLNVPSTNAFFVAPPGTDPASVSVRYNFARDLPPNTSTGFTRTWQGNAGLRFSLPHEWQLETSFSYGRTRDVSNSFGGLNTPALNAALASSDPQTAFDPFGLHRTSPEVLALIGNQIFLAPTLNRLTLYQASADGPLFSIGGNQVRLAFGYERQEIETDLGVARGNPGTPTTFRSFGRSVDSGYAELFVPIFGDGNAMPGLERLELSAAIRHDRYSDVGSTTNPKIGIVWGPLRNLRFRGSYGTSFRAPIFSQIYGNSNNLFVQRYTDPTQGGALVTGVALSGANTELRPEEAKTWTAGVDFEPVRNARISLTYFDVDYKGQVETYLSDLGILGREETFAGTGIILRGEEAAARVAELIASGIGVLGVLPNPVTVFVDGRNFNLGRSITRGIDVEGSYRFDTGSLGALTLSVNGTYLTDYLLAQTPTATPQDRLDTIFNPLRFKARAVAAWEYGNALTRLQVNHVGGYTNDIITPSEKVEGYTTLDIGVAFNVGDPDSRDFFDSGMTFGIDVRNVFDTNPPYVNLAPSGNGSGGYDATVANPIGRLFSFYVRKRW